VQLLNLIIQLILIIGGALLGTWFGEDKTFLFIICCVIVAEAIIISFLLKKNEKLEDEIKTETTRVSEQVLEMRLRNQNNIDISISPKKHEVLNNVPYTRLNITFDTPIQASTELGLSLDFEEQIKVFDGINLIQPFKLHGEYKYYVDYNKLTNHDNRFFSCKLFIEEIQNQDLKFKITVQDPSLRGSKNYII